MKRIKIDYSGWALCCIAREINKAWVKKNYMGRVWIRRMCLFEDFSNPEKYFTGPHTTVARLIATSQHGHWQGKADMIRELQRRLDAYNQQQNGSQA